MKETKADSMLGRGESGEGRASAPASSNLSPLPSPQGSSYIYVKKAREHNLKGIDVRIPRNTLTVITGLSGSGKSSLAFDTIYAEGQRRYVESLSAYARQFLDQMHKPDVESIEGLSPAISIEQRIGAANPRSTVGTVTEIYDYLRLLFASIGVQHCPESGVAVTSQTSQEIVDKIMALPDGTKLQIIAPIIEGKKGEYRDVFQEIQKMGFTRARIDGEVRELQDDIALNKKLKHTIEIIIDRVLLKKEAKKRITDSVESGLRAGKGRIKALFQSESGKEEERLYSELRVSPVTGKSFEKLEPRMFSFNSPYGACADCNGLGNKMEIDPKLIIPDPTKSIREGAIIAWRKGGKSYVIYLRRLLRRLAERNHFSLETPWNKLTKGQQDLILYGEEEAQQDYYNYFEGVIPNLERRFRETESEYMKNEINKYMSEQPCPACNGRRLKRDHLFVWIAQKSIMDVCDLSVDQAIAFFDHLNLTPTQAEIAKQILKEIRERLVFMKDVGLGYLTLSRVSGSLSGGEAQRIRLATQIGSRLTGVLYVLDEPSIGLHQRDNQKLLNTMKSLRDLGNTLLVVEHDEETMLESDYILDLGPGAGKNGGYLVAAGTPQEIMSHPTSLTGHYLSGKIAISLPKTRRNYTQNQQLVIKGASEHNLKDIDVELPLGVFICVTGVSGSGKSTLVEDILCRALKQKLYNSRERAGKHHKIVGYQHIDKIIEIDQSPIGRTPRSNPATYTGLWGPVREIFSRLPESRVRGYAPGRFSFNVKGGRCEACEGDGAVKIEMHFLPDVYVECEVCKGRRFNEQTLDIKFKGKNIHEVLRTSIDESIDLFGNVPTIVSKLQTLQQVGLGYVELGQSSTTLSGGEAQRVKLATELSKRATGKTLYILDEPTTGLHFDDVAKLLNVLQQLVDKGNTILVIEHNLDVIKNADYVVDLGPEGGDKGGQVVFTGSPEELIRCKASYTGQYLKRYIPKT